jgi:hypothetical protein
MDRKQLETKIERQTYRFLSMIKESSSDSVMLWANRNRVDVDTALLQRILDQYKAALESEYLGKIDHFMKNLDEDLEKFSNEKNPFPLTEEAEPKKKSPKAKKTS